MDLRMEYFVTKVEETVKKLVPEFDVETRLVPKDNGLTLHGICICPKGEDIAPTIYLENYFQDFEEGTSVDEIARYIIAYANAWQRKIPVQKDIGKLCADFEWVKQHLAVKLINAEANKELLNSIPHRIFGDMAIVYRVLIETNTTEQMASIIVKTEHLTLWGNKTEEELYEIAMENSKILLPSEARSMIREIYDMMDVPKEIEEPIPAELDMYICTNEQNICGSSVILYGDALKNVSHIVDSDLFVLPATVHESYCFSTKNFSPDSARELFDVIVGDIPQEEVLSREVFIYKKETGSLEIMEETV